MANKPGAPINWSSTRIEEWIRKIAQVVNQIQKGQANNSFKILLDENATTTEILVSFAALGQIAVFSPQDTATAVEVGNGTIHAVVTQGKITIHHVSTTGPRTLGVALFG